MSIVEKIGVPALLEQTAEECCELAQACLKMARKLRDENPTPKSIEDIRDNLVEEAVDVTICLDEIIATTDLIGDVEMFNVKASKLYRWEKRLGLSLDLEEDDVVYSD